MATCRLVEDAPTALNLVTVPLVTIKSVTLKSVIVELGEVSCVEDEIPKFWKSKDELTYVRELEPVISCVPVKNARYVGEGFPDVVTPPPPPQPTQVVTVNVPIVELWLLNSVEEATPNGEIVK